MSLYFDWSFSPLQIVLLGILFLVLCGELVYLYAIYHRVYRYGKRAAAGRVEYVEELPGISVIVYAHTDAVDETERLLKALLRQDYPRYEVIVVQDGSTDEVHHLVSHYECEYRNVYQTYVPETVYNVSRKKLGITLGVKAAQHDVVVVTEANCCPVDDTWLQTLGRNFVQGVDVVLGYTRMESATQKNSCYMVYDRVLFALRYLSYVLLRRPYMGVSGNLAYRKTCFFANRGFSSTLNLHFGDDDLFVNEVANRSNVRIEVAPESVVESSYADNKQAWKELRERYGFTAKYLHTSSKVVFSIESVLHYLMWLATVATVIAAFPNLLFVAVAVLLFVLYWVLTGCVYAQVGHLLGEHFRAGLTPFYQLYFPWKNLGYKIIGRRENKSNFTWQYLR